jgi:hypothetical protein
LVVAFTLLLAALSLSLAVKSLSNNILLRFIRTLRRDTVRTVGLEGDRFCCFFSPFRQNLKRLDRQSIIRWVAAVSDTLPPTTPTPTGPFSP